MKVAIVIDSLIRGGAERQAVYATRELVRNGVDVELIYYNVASECYDSSELLSDRLVHLPKEGKPVRYLLKLRSYFRRRSFDVVHGWMSGPGIYAGIAARAARVPVVFAGFRCEYDGTGLIRAAHRFVNHVVTGWIVNSQATVTSMVSGVGANPEKVYVVYNGIEPDAFVSKFTTEQAKTRLGLAPDCQTVSIVGQLRAQKNHPLFLKVASLVVRERPGTRFLVVGHGDANKQGELEALATNLNVDKRVHFLGSRSDIPDILAATDVTILTSNYEGVSNSLLEAMCVRSPVVSTAYAGVDELITHGENGLIAPLGDAAALAAHVCQLLREPDLRRRLGECGYQTIRERFTMSAMGTNLLAIYQKALDKAGRRS